MPDEYLPLVDSKGGPDLVTYSKCSERYLRGKIKAGEIRSWRASPASKILVRPSWFDDFVDRMQTEDFKFSDEVRKFGEELLAL